MSTIDTYASKFVFGGGNNNLVTLGYQNTPVATTNCIVINALSSDIAGATGNACYMAPIRSIGNNNSVTSLLAYNTTSKEIQFATDVTMSGTIAATSYFSSSDRRLKTNIQPFPPVLDKVKEIHPVQFEWKSDGKKDYGFIAQEFFQKMDFLRDVHHYTGVDDLKDASGSDVYYSMEYPKITAILCKALQEVADDCQQLRQKNDTLMNRLEILENETTSLRKSSENLASRLERLESKMTA